MDDHRFDALTRAMASAGTRRRALKGLLAAGSLAVTGMAPGRTEAARRGFAGPTLPTPKPCVRDHAGVCCSSGVLEPGDRCCPLPWIDSLGFCCDPEGSGGWTGCCCQANISQGDNQTCWC